MKDGDSFRHQGLEERGFLISGSHLMKKFLIPVLMITFLYGCNKQSSPEKPPAPTVQVAQQAPSTSVPVENKTELPQYNTSAYCKQVSDVVGGSYTIESSCIKRENRVKDTLSTMSIDIEILRYCDQVAQVTDGSYSILQACIKRETDAKKELGR